MGLRTAGRCWVFAPLLALAGGCADSPFGAAGGSAGETAAPAAVRLVDRDVEAPEVFQVTEPGLWDGRPSLGGVWVAHPDAEGPERVIIRNPADDSFVIGALFHRDRAGTGPALQVSSDAAEALGLIAGQPRPIEVTALRRESVPEAPAAVDPPADDAAAPADAGGTTGAGAPAEAEGEAPEPVISVSPLAAAEAAIARTEDADVPPRQAVTAAAEPPSRATPRVSSLDRPFIQIGFFSQRENAEATDARLRDNGILPVIREQRTNDKTYWRVAVGPARDRAERADLLAQIRGMGFADAYFVAD